MKDQPVLPPSEPGGDRSLWHPSRFARRILQSAGEGIVVYDSETRYRVWNRFMEQRTGVGASDLLGRRATEVFPHLVAGGIVGLIELALEGESVESADFRYDVPGRGREGWFAGRYEPYADDEGAVVGVIAHVRDITARKEAEERLRDSEARFRTIIESATDIVTILDGFGVVTYASPSTESVLGVTPREFVSRNPIVRVHVEDRQRVLGSFREMLRLPGEAVRVQYRSQHVGGSWRTLVSTGRNLLHEPSVAGIVVNSRDVTDWQELQERLHQSQRIEAIGRLAGGVAHDFNNLLTVISGNAQLLLADSVLAPVMRDELDEIAQAAERAATLTRQLLAFSRQQVLQPRLLDLGVVVDEMWKLLDRLVGEAVTLERRSGESLGAVMADPVQIEQVLINLVVNARDAMPDGGKIVVETAAARVSPSFAEQHAPMPPGDYTMLAVRDSGPGMDAETMARIFEPFFTTKTQGRGTGMGLSTVYGIVKQSGGYIWVESEAGRGSSFLIYLPNAAESLVRERPPARRTTVERRGTETILVVEDEDLVRAMTRRTLERTGYRVCEARNGLEALEIARELGDSLDLLLTDIVMPVMGGRELASTLQRERPGIRILFMSGYTNQRETALSEGGISGFMHKPFTLDELRARVRALLDRVATTG